MKIIRQISYKIFENVNKADQIDKKSSNVRVIYEYQLFKNSQDIHIKIY